MLPASFATPAAVILTLGGLIACFAGYRLFRFVLGLYGFYLGAIVTTAFMPPTNTWALVMAAIVGGVVGALLIVGAYFVGVGLIGAGLAALALLSGWHAVMHAEPPTVVLVVVAVLGALGALSIVRYVVVFGSAIAGSWTAVVGRSCADDRQVAARGPVERPLGALSPRPAAGTLVGARSMARADHRRGRHAVGDDVQDGEKKRVAEKK